MKLPRETPEIAKLLWDFIDSWRLEPGRQWLSEDTKRFSFQETVTPQHPPLMSEVTVTLQVPPPRMQACTNFLRQKQKDAGAAPGDTYGLPSDLDLVNTAADNANLLHQLQIIGDICTGVFTAGPQTEREALDSIREVVSVTLRDHRGGTVGATILERMRQQREAIMEKSVDVSAELIKNLDMKGDF